MKIKYVIYELVKPTILDYIVNRNYSNTVVERTVLEDVNDVSWGFNTKHETLESALAEIEKYKKELVGRKFTIQTVIEIDY